MTVSVGAATDNLYAKAQTAVNGVTVNGKPAVAADGQIEEPAFGVLAVGMTEPPPDGVGDIIVRRSWAEMGDRYVDEEYTIPCYIDVRVSGKTQKTARDAAEGIFNTFWIEILADLELGGAISGGQPVEIVDYRSSGSNVGTVAEPGRRQLITFGVHCLNLTT